MKLLQVKLLQVKLLHVGQILLITDYYTNKQYITDYVLLGEQVYVIGLPYMTIKEPYITLKRDLLTLAANRHLAPALGSSPFVDACSPHLSLLIVSYRYL